MECQICDSDLSSLSTLDRQAHYDLHFEDSAFKAPHNSNQSKASPNKNDTPQQSFKRKQKGKWKTPFEGWREPKGDIFWHPAMESPPPENFTPGLITLLKKALLKSHANGATTRAVLCYERTTLINAEPWDIGWGCGYRNFLMACSALMDQQLQPMYFPALNQPFPPGVRNLQRWIEEAWHNGFDQEGYKQLRKLVDTSKWIGTADLCTAFVYRGLPAELADFEAKDDDIRPLTKWIVDHFDRHKSSNSNSLNEALSGASPVQTVLCMPLVIQNAGHSRLVVGYEMAKGGAINLLIFDPSTKPAKKIRKAALNCYFVDRSSRPTRASASPGEKRPRSELDEIVYLGHSSASESKRQKMVPSRHDNTSTDADDEVVIVGENIRSNGAKAAVNDTMSKEEERDVLKDVLKLCRWQNQKVK
ncbi:hypothetical protein AAF712_009789 [Marasmius tenuissimus]|uniref:UFSP1/2/DUB catalytic domain-containing protein n=1 Tax=Marasmius tenuissimus TaxID=585030 RepID=A0ABR2ZR03_9AGAR